MFFLTEKLDKQEEVKLTSALHDSDEKAFQKIFNLYYESLFAFVYTRIRSVELSRDLVQDSFSKLWMHRRTLNPNQGCKAYLFRIADRLLIDYYRKRSSQKKYQQEQRYAPNSVKSDIDLQITLQNCINNLPDKLREVFVLSRYQGYTYAEIAEACHISVKTVESRMSKALKQLRLILTDE